MKVIIHNDRQVFVTTTKLGNDLENNAEILEFKFPKELEDYSKYLEVETTDGKYVTQISNDKYSITNNLTKYSRVKMQIICKDLANNVTFKSNIFEVTIDNSINASEDLPEEQPELITQIQEDISNLQSNKANKSETYTKTQVNSLLDNKANINDIPDVSDFITNTVDNLVNYYKKTETYTQTEVNSLISAISTMNILVVQTLPTQDISTTTIYLLPRQTSETNNVYDEYIYVSNNWEKIGSTDIDLSNYYTKAEVDTLLANIDLSNYYTKTQVDALIPDISGKQDTLVSGTNIKTINNNSILGSGNVSIQEGETLPVGTEVDFDGTSADIPVGWEQTSEKDPFAIYKKQTVLHTITKSQNSSGKEEWTTTDDCVAYLDLRVGSWGACMLLDDLKVYDTSINGAFLYPMIIKAGTKVSINEYCTGTITLYYEGGNA